MQEDAHIDVELCEHAVDGGWHVVAVMVLDAEESQPLTQRGELPFGPLWQLMRLDDFLRCVPPLVEASVRRADPVHLVLLREQALGNHRELLRVRPEYPRHNHGKEADMHADAVCSSTWVLTHTRVSNFRSVIHVVLPLCMCHNVSWPVPITRVTHVLLSIREDRDDALCV